MHLLLCTLSPRVTRDTARGCGDLSAWALAEIIAGRNHDGQGLPPSLDDVNNDPAAARTQTVLNNAAVCQANPPIREGRLGLSTVAATVGLPLSGVTPWY